MASSFTKITNFSSKYSERAGDVVQQSQLSLGTINSLITAWLVSAARFPIHLPTNDFWEREDGSHAWASATHMGDIKVFQLMASAHPGPSYCGHLGIGQWMKDTSLSHSLFILPLSLTSSFPITLPFYRMQMYKQFQTILKIHPY